MPNSTSQYFRINTAEQLHESLNEPSPTRLYMFIGRSIPFANDLSPPAVSNSDFTYNSDIYRDMISLKRINYNDTLHVVPRYDWVTGTVYTQYDHTNSNLYNLQFYILTSENHVYKCIDNNRGAQSTVEPKGTGTSIITTADGYRWKFMYAIPSADAQKFLTSTSIPVRELTANNGSAQWAVQQSAANGSIDHIEVTANGAGYITTSNTFVAVTNSTVIRLANNALQVDGAYVGSTMYISSGLGVGQLRRIIRYVGVNRIATVNGFFTVLPNTSSRYYIAPNVIIKGDSGSVLAQRATAYVSNCIGGQVRKITMISGGRNYGVANVEITANSFYGSGATAKPIISPPGGHGSFARKELNGKDIMMSITVTNSESNTFPTNNDFRVIGMIRDPLMRSGLVANAATIDQCHRVVVSGVTGDYRADEIITGTVSGAKGRVVYFMNTNSTRTRGILRLVRVSTGGTGLGFAQTETVTATTSGVSATVINAIKPAIKEYTGDVLYIENRTPVTRKPDQIEDFRFVVTF